MAHKAMAEKVGKAYAYHGNIVDLLEYIADHDIHAVGAQLLDVFIVIERIVFHRFDVDSLYFHSKAPFFHA